MDRSLDHMYSIITDQTYPHPKLFSLVDHHRQVIFKPEPLDTECCKILLALRDSKQPLILDSGCGKAMSTGLISAKYPLHHVIGVDRSPNRLQPRARYKSVSYLLCDCVSLWFFCLQNDIHFDYHYLLYPNPYPKKKHIKKRWYGHPILSTLLNIGQQTIVRSNWDIYIREFAFAANLHGFQSIMSINTKDSVTSHFEQKYQGSHETTYQIKLSRTSTQ